MYTVKELSELLKVAPRTIYGWIREGKLDVVRLPGGGIRIPTGAIPGVETVVAEVEDGGE